MKLKVNKYCLWVLCLGTGLGYTSCSLDEYNPSGYTFENVAASSIEGYEAILNNIYFGMERCLYGSQEFMPMAEAGTDIWTSAKNADNLAFKYGQGGDFQNNWMDKPLNCWYDGVGSCNVAIQMAELAPYTTVEDKNTKVAEAYFMRAVYYYHLVEQLGGVTLHLKPTDQVDLRPGKTAPLDIYKQCIIPDLEFAVQWLPVKDASYTTRPAKKAAMGFLLRAYLQTVEYDAAKEYAPKALELAKDMMADLEGGGSRYNIQWYDNIEDVFAQANNQNNKEALWQHRYVKSGTSNETHKLNRNDELFYCFPKQFSAIQFSNDKYTQGEWAGKNDYLLWGHRSDGQFMPTQYLLHAYVQDDGSLDPRYHVYFQTDWLCNREKGWGWNEDSWENYDRTFDKPVKGQTTEADTLRFMDMALRFIRPGDADYDRLLPTKRDSRVLLVDYKDLYDDASHGIIMEYYNNRKGKTELNPYLSFYPSLNKHNSDNYSIENESKKRYGNLNATFMMRSVEIYLLAAEADIYVNGGANAMGYINKVRARAGARPLQGTADIQTVLDERARELCGEYVRFYDLKRTHMLNKEYLMATNPDVGYFFINGKHELRPFPSSFLENLQDGGLFYQNPGY